MEVSALKYSGGIGLHARSPLLRLQSDERLIAFTRKGSPAAFEALVARYESRLLAFCRHLLGSREDAEDVLQEVMTAAFNAILADERPINVRPWLYRIARNRSLNHLRRIQAIAVDSMDQHLSEHGTSTADKVHEREEFRLLVGDIHELPETQKTALVLREMDAMSYEQIAEAMETTVSSVKSLLVRARVSLAEASEARLLSCNEVRIELAEVAEGLQRRPGPLVRRHLKDCKRCGIFRDQLKQTNKALAALLPVGPLVVLRKLAFAHLGHSAGAGSSATAAGSSAAGAGAAGAAGTTALAGSGAIGGSGGFISAGIGAIAGKAAAGLAAAALVTAGAVEVDHSPRHRRLDHPNVPAALAAVPATRTASAAPQAGYAEPESTVSPTPHDVRPVAAAPSSHTTPPHTTDVADKLGSKPAANPATATKPATPSKPVTATKPVTASKPAVATKPATATIDAPHSDAVAAPPGRTQTQSDLTVLPTAATMTTPTPASPVSPTPDTGTSGASTSAPYSDPTPTSSSPTPTTPTTTSTTPDPTTPDPTTPVPPGSTGTPTTPTAPTPPDTGPGSPTPTGGVAPVPAGSPTP